MKLNEPREMVLEGVVIPVAWRSSGEVLDVGLMTFDEAEYRIDPGTDGDHGLGNYLRKRVRLSAVLRGDRLIEVRRVEVLGNTDPGGSSARTEVTVPNVALGHEEEAMMEETRVQVGKSKTRRPEERPGLSRATRVPPTTPEERRSMIAEEAYHRAARRGFCGGDPVQDWLEAEAEIDARLVRGDADHGARERTKG